MSHDAYETALAAVRELHTDTSVPITTTLESLESLAEELESIIDVVAYEVKQQEHG